MLTLSDFDMVLLPGCALFVQHGYHVGAAELAAEIAVMPSPFAVADLIARTAQVVRPHADDAGPHRA